ncbi:hypothetical protein [Paraburkholderia bonniea]|uniref:hypothetical protein n=1 Tax=Paraburkholderia bonniea TaxID=2152891 RepID=UPI0012926D72|nr:hypothetical protein [Paraburkholderia bonniea]
MLKILTNFSIKLFPDMSNINNKVTAKSPVIPGKNDDKNLNSEFGSISLGSPGDNRLVKEVIQGGSFVAVDGGSDVSAVCIGGDIKSQKYFQDLLPVSNESGSLSDAEFERQKQRRIDELKTRQGKIYPSQQKAIDEHSPDIFIVENDCVALSLENLDEFASRYEEVVPPSIKNEKALSVAEKQQVFEGKLAAIMGLLEINGIEISETILKALSLGLDDILIFDGGFPDISFEKLFSRVESLRKDEGRTSSEIKVNVLNVPETVSETMKNTEYTYTFNDKNFRLAKDIIISSGLVSSDFDFPESMLKVLEKHLPEILWRNEGGEADIRIDVLYEKIDQFEKNSPLKAELNCLELDASAKLQPGNLEERAEQVIKRQKEQMREEKLFMEKEKSSGEKATGFSDIEFILSRVTVSAADCAISALREKGYKTIFNTGGSIEGVNPGNGLIYSFVMQLESVYFWLDLDGRVIEIRKILEKLKAELKVKKSENLRLDIHGENGALLIKLLSFLYETVLDTLVVVVPESTGSAPYTLEQHKGATQKEVEAWAATLPKNIHDWCVQIKKPLARISDGTELSNAKWTKSEMKIYNNDGDFLALGPISGKTPQPLLPSSGLVSK